MSRTVGSDLAWYTMLPVAVHVFRFANSILLARLLDPEDFGLIGIALVLVYFSNSLTDFGFSKGIVQGRNVNESHFSALLTVNLVLAAIFYFIVCVGSASAERFFDIPYLGNAIDAVATVILLSGVAATSTARLRRELAFRALAIIEALKVVCSMSISLPMAMMGFSFWSIIAATVASTALSSMLLILSAGGIPRPSFNLSPLRDLVSFSLWDFAGSQIKLLSEQGDKLIIGKILGASSLGFYDKAYGLTRMPNDQIAARVAQVSFATLARLQDKPDELRRVYRKMLTVTSVILCPTFLGLYVVADDFVMVLLGEKWAPMIPAFKILCLSFLASALASIAVSANQAMGFARQQTLARGALVCLLLAGLLMSAKWGITAAAIVTLAYNALFLISAVIITRQCIDDSGSLALRAVLPAMAIALVMCLVLVASDQVTADMSAGARLILASGLGMLIYTGLFFLIPAAGHAFLKQKATGMLGKITAKIT